MPSDEKIVNNYINWDFTKMQTTALSLLQRLLQNKKINLQMLASKVGTSYDTNYAEARHHLYVSLHTKYIISNVFFPADL